MESNPNRRGDVLLMVQVIAATERADGFGRCKVFPLRVLDCVQLACNDHLNGATGGMSKGGSQWQ
jgi:hypothetical protein